MTIIVIAETEAGDLTTATLECLEEAGEVAVSLASTVHVFLPGYEVTPLVETLAAHGAQTVTVIDHEALRYFSGDGWLAALEGPLKEGEAALMMTPDSSHSRVWLPRLAARWRVPLVSRCSQVRVKAGGVVEITHPIYNGLQRETSLAPVVTPLLVTLLPGLRGVSAPDPTRQAEVISLTPDLDPTTWRDRTQHRLPPDPNTVDLSEAERIVSGGLGIGGPEGVALLEQLAQALRATVGGTRVISDRGWIPHERYIGSTGKTVAPKLYLALGISGASQHTVGMSNSETIIAVNIDRTAPIFGLADLGIVGDLQEVVPRLVAKLEKESTKHGWEAHRRQLGRVDTAL